MSAPISTSDTLAFNPFLPEVHEDPYPLYHRLRAEDPVHRSALGFWVLTRHADAVSYTHLTLPTSDLV